MSFGLCVMGCKEEEGISLHSFPRNAKRRAEWCNILGITTQKKRIYLCSAHIPKCYINGSRISVFTKPNPPDSKMLDAHRKKLENQRHEYTPRFDVQQLGLKTVVAKNLSQDHTNFESSSEYSVTDVGHEAENIPQSEVQQSGPQTLVTEQLKQENNNFESSEDCNATPEADETASNVENFEIRKGSNNDMIIKGRCIQTKDHLIVSYTPPKKWSLQVQVGLLDKICTNQLDIIKLRTKENYRLFLQLKQHEKLLPKLRYMQKKIRSLSVQLKMFKMQNKNQRRIIRARRLKKRTLTTFKRDKTENK